MPVDSPTEDGGVPRPEETDACGNEGESGASGANESHAENARLNANVPSEKGAIGSLIVAVFSFAAMTIGMDPSELQLQQAKNDADSGHLQNENQIESLSNATATTNEGNSSGHGNQTKGNKSDVKMKKQILDAGSLLTATVGLNAKMKQHTIIEMEDNISPNVKDDVIPPDLKKFDEVQFDNKSPKGTKHLAKHAVENSALPIKAASHQQLLDAFEETGKFVESDVEKKKEQQERVSGSDNFMERALHVSWETGTVALVTSLKTQAEESALKNEIEISTTVSETQQNGSTESDNKVKPFNDASPQSTTSGSEDGSELGGKVQTDGKRRESFSFKAVAWAIATMTMHPSLRIKVAPKDSNEENMTLQDFSSSGTEQNEPSEPESAEMNGKSIDKSTQTDMTPEQSNASEDDVKPGPSRMSKMAVGGPDVITPADFTNNDNGELQDDQITSLKNKEPGNVNNGTSDGQSSSGIVRWSRATQTANLVVKTRIGNNDASPSLSASATVSMSKFCFGHVLPCAGKQPGRNPLSSENESPSKDEVHDQYPFSGTGGISGESTTTSTQTDQPEITDSRTVVATACAAGFLGRIKRFFKRSENKLPAPDVENQLEDALCTSNSVSVGSHLTNSLRSVARHEYVDKFAYVGPSEEMELTETASNGSCSNPLDSTGYGKQEGKANTILDMEDVDETTWNSHNYNIAGQTSLLNDGLQNVVTEQPRKTIIKDVDHQQQPEQENDCISKASSNRSTQTEENPTPQINNEPHGTILEGNIRPMGILGQVGNGIRTFWHFTAAHDVNKQLEENVKCDAALGFSTFTVDENGELKETTGGKVRFVVIMLLAMFNVWKEIRKVVWYIQHNKPSKDKEKVDNTFWYVNIAYQVSILLLLIGHFALIWWGQRSVGKAVKSLRNTRPPKNNKSRFSARGLRTLSVVTGIALILCGNTVLKTADEYSIEEVWVRHELELYEAVVPGALSKALGETASTTIGTITTPVSTNALTSASNWPDSAMSTVVPANSTLKHNVTSDEPPTPPPGLFIWNGIFETLIFGSISVGLDLIGQITFTSAPDYLIVIGFIIWRYVEVALRVDHLTLTDDKGNPLTPEELERRKILAKEILAEYDEFMEVTAELNNVGKVIWPALLLTAIFMLSYLIHLMVIGQWFEAVYYFVHLSKIFVIFFIGLKIAHRVDKFVDWFVSKAGRTLLDLDNHEFDRRNEEIKRRPVALGIGATLVCLKFLFGFFGIVSSNVILLTQSFFTQ